MRGIRHQSRGSPANGWSSSLRSDRKRGQTCSGMRRIAGWILHSLGAPDSRHRALLCQCSLVLNVEQIPALVFSRVGRDVDFSRFQPTGKEITCPAGPWHPYPALVPGPVALFCFDTIEHLATTGSVSNSATRSLAPWHELNFCWKNRRLTCVPSNSHTDSRFKITEPARLTCWPSLPGWQRVLNALGCQELNCPRCDAEAQGIMRRAY